MTKKKLIWKISLGILILAIGILFLNNHKNHSEIPEFVYSSNITFDDFKVLWSDESKYSWAKIKPLTISLKGSTQTNIDIEIALQFVTKRRKKKDIRRDEFKVKLSSHVGELREETIRELSQHTPQSFLENFQEGFLSKDLERAFNRLLGCSTAEERILKVKFTSFNFRYSTKPKLTGTPPNLASIGALLSSEEKEIASIYKKDPPTGTSTINLERCLLPLFTAPLLEWPSRTVFLEAQIVCSSNLEFLLAVEEKEDVLKEETIKHISKYNGSQLIESFRSGKLQERLKQIYRRELYGSQKPQIHRVIFSTFYMAYPPVSPNLPK